MLWSLLKAHFKNPCLVAKMNLNWACPPPKKKKLKFISSEVQLPVFLASKRVLLMTILIDQ